MNFVSPNVIQLSSGRAIFQIFRSHRFLRPTYVSREEKYNFFFFIKEGSGLEDDVTVRRISDGSDCKKRSHTLTHGLKDRARLLEG